MYQLLKDNEIGSYRYDDENNMFVPKKDYTNTLIIRDLIKLINILTNMGISYENCEDYSIIIK